MVVKFSAKIDQQYRDTIKYYSKLLPQFFSENNVLVVMTDYTTDPRSVAIREEQGIDAKENMKNVIREIVNSANLNYEPMLFTIDGLPYSKTEMSENERKREDILSYILSQPSVRLRDLHIAKTMALLEEDQKEIQRLEGEIDGYNWRLKEVNKNASVALDSTHKVQKSITDITAEIAKSKSEREENDSDNLITIKTWKIDDNKFFPWWRSRDIDLKTDVDILDVRTWTNGSSKFVKTERSDRVYKAKL